MSKPKTFFLDVKFSSLPTGQTMRIVISDINYIIGQGDSKSYKVIHKFKVTGEPRVITVIETIDSDAGLEKIVGDLAELGIFDVTCTPLTSYEAFAKNLLAVDPGLTSPPTRRLDKKHTFWIKVTVGYNGMTLEQLKNLWKREAEVALDLRINGMLSMDNFKVLTRWEVDVFMSLDDPEQLDVLMSKLPLFIENGHNTNSVCRAVQQLEAYIASNWE